METPCTHDWQFLERRIDKLGSIGHLGEVIDYYDEFIFYCRKCARVKKEYDKRTE